MAKGQEIKVGPWPGGLNQIEDIDLIQDNQLSKIINFDVDNSGSLVARRGLTYCSLQVNTATDTMLLMGSVIIQGEAAVRTMVGRVRFTSPNYSTQFRLFSNPATPGTTFAPMILDNEAPGRYGSVVQYQDKFWYVPYDSLSVGRSSPSLKANTLTTVSAMPYGDYGFILKDRMFIVRKAASEIYFSKATDFTVWSAPDGGVIKVNPGDSKVITKVVVLNNQIIIFKRNETYILSFNNSPTGDGVLRQVSPDQGAIDAITYNNEIYCFDARSVFKFVNGYFQNIGMQLNLQEQGSLDRVQFEKGKIHVVGNTLIVGIAHPFDQTAFAMNLDTGAWSEYEVDLQFAGIFSSGSITGRGDQVGRYVLFGDQRPELYAMLVERNASGGHNDFNEFGAAVGVRYEVQTKAYDFNDFSVWKRLHNWYADVIFPSAYVFGKFFIDVNPRRSISSETGEDRYETNAAVGLQGPSKSVRFRSLRFGFLGISFPGSDLRESRGPTIRSFKAILNVKSPMSNNITSPPS